MMDKQDKITVISVINSLTHAGEENLFLIS